MDQDAKSVIIAPRAMNQASLPHDWQSKIAAIKGIVVSGTAFGRMQVKATEPALRAARDEFGDALLIEEVVPRSLP